MALTYSKVNFQFRFPISFLPRALLCGSLRNLFASGCRHLVSCAHGRRPRKIRYYSSRPGHGNPGAARAHILSCSTSGAWLRGEALAARPSGVPEPQREPVAAVCFKPDLTRFSPRRNRRVDPADPRARNSMSAVTWTTVCFFQVESNFQVFGLVFIEITCAGQNCLEICVWDCYVLITNLLVTPGALSPKGVFSTNPSRFADSRPSQPPNHFGFGFTPDLFN